MYKATKTKLAQLKLAIDLKENTDLYSYLSVNMDKGLDFTTITKAIHSDGLNDKKQIIYRILENHWFHDYWSPENYYPQAVNIASYGWRLYNAIIDEMRKVAEKIKADIVIFPETEEGHYQWSLSWYRVTHNISFKANYLSHIPALKQLMKEKNIDVIENTQPYKRARNDPHPNIEGNNQIAGDIWKYLMRSRKNELELYKKITNY
jgi:hypothetical protein